jgi:hypothetical protein
MTIHEIIGGGIALYAGWLRGVKDIKITAIAHEIGHVLLITVSNVHTQDNSLMDLYRRIVECFILINN